MLLTIFIFVILICDTHSLHFEGDLQSRNFTAYCTCTCTTFVPCWQPLDASIESGDTELNWL